MSSQRCQPCRRASHAGSWYEGDGNILNSQLEQWLSIPPTVFLPNLRAIIAPHAGYSYSGSTAAFAYKNIAPAGIKRVFILGPSHHVHLPICN